MVDFPTLALTNALWYLHNLHFISHLLVVHDWLNIRVLHTVPTKEKIVGNATDFKHHFVHIGITCYAYHRLLLVNSLNGLCQLPCHITLQMSEICTLQCQDSVYPK
jgi:hypothetical protein